MILISELRTYIAAKQAELPLVNSSRLAVNESDVTRFLSAFSKTDNQLMLVLLPDARSTARDEDNIRMNNSLAFLFLEKSDYSSEKYDQWLDVFARTQESAIAFARKLIWEVNNGSCSFNRFLDYNNISIEPVNGLASCNGWSVEIYFDVPF